MWSLTPAWGKHCLTAQHFSDWGKSWEFIFSENAKRAEIQEQKEGRSHMVCRLTPITVPHSVDPWSVDISLYTSAPALPCFVCAPLSFSAGGFVQIETKPSSISISLNFPASSLKCQTPRRPKAYLLLMRFSGGFHSDLLGYFGVGNQSVVIVNMWQIATTTFRVNGRKQTPGGWFTLLLVSSLKTTKRNPRLASSALQVHTWHFHWQPESACDCSEEKMVSLIIWENKDSSYFITLAWGSGINCVSLYPI